MAFECLLFSLLLRVYSFLNSPGESTSGTIYMATMGYPSAGPGALYSYVIMPWAPRIRSALDHKKALYDAIICLLIKLSQLFIGNVQTFSFFITSFNKVINVSILKIRIQDC